MRTNMTKGELERFIASNKTAINDMKAQIEQLHCVNAELQSELDVINDPFNAKNLKRGQKFYENILGYTYILTKPTPDQYQLINIKTGGYYTSPTPNIEDVFGGARHKFTKLD